MKKKMHFTLNEFKICDDKVSTMINPPDKNFSELSGEYSWLKCYHLHGLKQFRSGKPWDNWMTSYHSEFMQAYLLIPIWWRSTFHDVRRSTNLKITWKNTMFQITRFKVRKMALFVLSCQLLTLLFDFGRDKSFSNKRNTIWIKKRKSILHFIASALGHTNFINLLWD